MKIFILICLAFFILGCKEKKISYLISDTYTGPCIVFVYPSLNSQVKYDISINHGLGRVDSRYLASEFHFVSLESNRDINVIPIGGDKNVQDSSRCIFELFNNTTSSSCIEGEHDIRNITFYIGRKTDYTQWSNRHLGYFNYFEIAGVDWCAFYKAKR